MGFVVRTSIAFAAMLASWVCLSDALAGDILVYDSFSRYPDNAVMSGQNPIVGPPWRTTGGQLPTISGGKLGISADTGGYLYNVFPKAPQTLGADVSLVGSGGFTLAYAANSDPMSVNDLLHLYFNSTGFALDIRQSGGPFETILVGDWVVPITGTGTVAMSVQGDKVSIQDPGGGNWSISDPRVPSVVGTTAYWQPIYHDASNFGQGINVYATVGLPTYAASTAFDPQNKSQVDLLAPNYYAQSAANGGADGQVRTVSSNTSNLVYFEVRAKNIFNADQQWRQIGISTVNHSFGTKLGNDSTSCGWALGAMTSFNFNGNSSPVATGGAMQVAQGDVLAFAFDFIPRKAWYRNVTKNTGWNNDVPANQNPSNNTGGVSFEGIGAGPYYITIGFQQYQDAFMLNTGQMPYSGTVPPGFSNWIR
jgi:hypothetical protein